MTRPNRIRRSELSTPATSEKMITKAAASDADLVFLDLEDAVAPSAKTGARKNIVAALNDLDWGDTVRAFRCNSVDTKWCHGDIIEVVTGAGANLDIVIIPKIKGPRELWFVDDLLTQLELDLGLEVGRIGIEVLIEEVEALQTVNEIATCSPRLEAMILGVGDLSASQGMRLGHIGTTAGQGSIKYPGDIWHYARVQMIVAARSAGIDAIDGPFANFTRPDAYEESAATFAMMGGVGKWAIHPSQIAPANKVFAPSEADVELAQAAIGAVREAEARGDGAATFEGMMIDAATARMFEVTLERARMCGMTSGGQP
ncbi:MAG: CoA ester lyase [Actinomycetia bacterium]|nr:CoA ester lyase [Actinomycetes bacterium]MCP4962452.1 CoA ester lyase [Actinomycetes bacterium]